MNLLLNSLFDHLLNQPVRRVKLGHGSFLTLGFGPDLQVEITKRGQKEIKLRPEWLLWTYMCLWNLEVDNSLIVSSDSERETIEKELPLLQDKKFLKAVLINPFFEIKLEFEDKITLSLFPDNSENDNIQWRLYTPEKKVFVAGPLSQFSYEDSST